MAAGTSPSDPDKTVLRPTPGGRPPAPPGGAPPVPPGGGPPPPPTTPPPTAPPLPSGGPAPSRNPLLNAAGHLLALIGRVRGLAQHADPDGLYRQVTEEIQRFELAARAQGIGDQGVLGGRYALCAAVDEAVLNTPWGGQSAWANQTILSRFHKETGGGEKFFQILETICRDPHTHIDLLELKAACLALGFQGRYRMRPNGMQELAALTDRVFELIRSVRGAPDPELSPQWHGAAPPRADPTRKYPLWVVAAVAAALALAIHVGFQIALGGAADPVRGKLDAIRTGAMSGEAPR
jgi:type VI secretion system protein ImpK